MPSRKAKGSGEEIISFDDWREELKSFAAKDEPPDENWATLQEITQYSNRSHRWVQRVAQEGYLAGKIREPISVRHSAAAPVKYWYAPEVVAQLKIRAKVNGAGSRVGLLGSKNYDDIMAAKNRIIEQRERQDKAKEENKKKGRAPSTEQRRQERVRRNKRKAATKKKATTKKKSTKRST